jgi:hypothetical protein
MWVWWVGVDLRVGGWLRAVYFQQHTDPHPHPPAPTTPAPPPTPTPTPTPTPKNLIARKLANRVIHSHKTPTWMISLTTRAVE